MPIPKKLLVLSAPLLGLLLTGCDPKPVQLALPPIERAEPVAFPEVPEGEAEGGALSDRQNAELIDALAGALDEANNKLLWIKDWIKEADEAG